MFEVSLIIVLLVLYALEFYSNRNWKKLAFSNGARFESYEVSCNLSKMKVKEMLDREFPELELHVPDIKKEELWLQFSSKLPAFRGRITFDETNHTLSVTWYANVAMLIFYSLLGATVGYKMKGYVGIIPKPFLVLVPPLMVLIMIIAPSFIGNRMKMNKVRKLLRDKSAQ